VKDEREQRALLYIKRSIAHIERDLAEDPLALSEEGTRAGRAILWSLMTLADATTKLSEDLQQRHPEIDWHAIRGFRNVAAHVYDRLRLREVGEIVSEALPILKSAVERELTRTT
jgi:uncharacterized protein with HEPN domain